MLRMNQDEYRRALDLMMKGEADAEWLEVRTTLGRLTLVLEALGEDFDVSAMDPVPRDDSEEVWGEPDENDPPFETDFDLAARAFGVPFKMVPRRWL